MIYRFTWFIFYALFQVLCRRRITGASHVPAEGPFILASNHVSVLDPPVVGTGIWRRPYYLAKEELFRHPGFNWYIRRLGAFPVKRGAGDRAALKHCLDLLADGKPLVLFPEGTRSQSGELQEPEMGVGMIAYRSGVPVVPAYVWGTNRVLPKSGRPRLAPIGVSYGPPLHFSLPEGQKPTREDYEAASRKIMTEIARLRDEERAQGREPRAA